MQAGRIALGGEKGFCTALQQVNNSRTGRVRVPGGFGIYHSF